MLPELGIEEHMSQADCAKALGTCRQNIRRIEQRALEKLRLNLIARGIKFRDLMDK